MCLMSVPHYDANYTYYTYELLLIHCCTGGYRIQYEAVVSLLSLVTRVCQWCKTFVTRVRRVQLRVA